MDEKIHRFSIPSDHPVLVDHFPGNPLVPGALIVDQVLSGCEPYASEDFCMLALKEIKFKSPLRGHEIAQVDYSQSPTGLRFKVWVADREIAAGIITLQPPGRD